MKKLLIISIIGTMVLFANQLANAQTQSIIVDTTITADCEFFPFGTADTIYGLSFSGSVVLNSDSSLVRLVYIDGDNNEWLLMEAYTLITSDTNVVYSKHCDETCYFEANPTASIVVEIIDASVTVDTLFYLPVLMAQAPTLQQQAKYNMDMDKVVLMNKYIEENNLRWTAEYNSITGLWYSDKKQLLGEKYNYLGFEYYGGGIFETVYTDPEPVYTDMVPLFDWRNRHDANVYGTPYFDGDVNNKTGWITSVSDQGTCGSCGIFSSVAAIEALGNLYFNKSDLDLNLSEQEVVSCEGSISICDNGIFPGDVFNYIENNRIGDSLSFPYADDDLPCNHSSHITPNYEVSIDGYSEQIPGVDVDDFIEPLIISGPYVINYDFTTPSGPHAILLVGYEINLNTNEIYWLIKNSWGKDWGGTIYGEGGGFGWISNEMETFHKVIAEAPIYYYGNNSPVVQCRDEDNDGICWWGIGENKPSSGCPECAEYRDCDDNDPSLGGYDENYFCECLYSYDYEPEVVSMNGISWNEPKLKDRDVIINSGITLTITSEVRMVETSRIIVEPGATLIIDGGRITNMCDEFWNGIELRGTANVGQYIQSAQGTVQLLNGAVIENAVVGIETIKKTRSLDDTWTTDYNYTGGIIQCEIGTQFLNCKTAVQFHPYPLNPLLPTENISYFNKTDFLVDDYYLPLNGSYDLSNYDLANMFEQLVYLDGVSEINFTACIFSQNIHFTQDSPKEWLGKGVFANNSTFHISSFWDSKCSFSNLEYGIFTISSQWWVSGFTSVRESEFNNNVCGIYASLPNNFSSPIEIILNDFIVEPKLYSDNASGIYLDNTSDFVVEENSFEGDFSGIFDGSGVDTYGIVVNNCGESDNSLYNDSLYRLNVGIQAQFKNRSRDGIHGLSILCNDYSICQYDEYIVAKQPLKAYHGIVENQGSNGTASTSPAGNTFYHTETPTQNDILNLTNDMIYWYHADTNGACVRPIHYTEDLVKPFFNPLNTYPFVKIESCPPRQSSSGGRDAQSSKAEMLASTSSADSLNNELSILVDAGDTELMNDDVQTSWPDETMELRADLLDASPYLSDTVMISAADKEDVLPNAILTEVLVANPQSAKSNKVMEAVDERDTLLTQNQYDQVMAGKLIAGAKEKLESRLTAAWSNRAFAMKNLVMAWHEDSLVNAKDSIINLLENEEKVQAKYALVDEYLSIHDTISATSAYNAIDTDFDLNNEEYDNWLDYEDWLDYRLEQVNGGKGITEPDSLQLVSLYQLYNDSDNQLKATLRNLLRFADTLSYNEPYLTVDTSMKTGNVRLRPSGSSKTHNELLIYPNPARNYFIIDFSGLNVDDDIVIVEVYSIDGKPLKELIINYASGFKVIDTRMWKSGSYVIALKGSGKIIGSKTMLVSH